MEFPSDGGTYEMNIISKFPMKLQPIKFHFIQD